MLSVQQHVQPDGYAILRAEGDLDAFTVSTFRHATADVAPASALVIDLSEVSFMDSAGLCAIVGGLRRARENTVRVVIAAPRLSVKKALVAAGVDRLVTLTDTVDEAALVLREEP